MRCRSIASSSLD